ncbi:hypothetical protein CAOG_03585 [Capsaspora owczarzaki ATCC 30864]|uniref:hypothetical protein n=1 Tax=Capsaspora owczarzaki (strain ATCC 30864) TaxID=595528 RepID=UPI0001FE3BA0|nr:hypothetical protein CAOG_03585 [Capsaspora owczarzaki ATCC 30864]|eukprot:XP_004363313.1 hypothetical protein CAOG_03585 [Capsaspora owczarzaki ATCC 30864]
MCIVTRPVLRSVLDSQFEMRRSVYGPTAAAPSDRASLSSLERALLELRDVWRRGIDRRLLSEVLPTLLMSGCGLMLSGVTLSFLMQSSEAFKAVPALVVLLPVLLGLKCCLEMTLASRLSTAFHTQLLSDAGPKDQRRSVIRANLGVVIIQATCVALLATAFAAGITSFESEEGWVSLHHLVVLLSSAVLTSCIAALLLGMFTAYVVMESSRRNVDPDNIAGPLVTGMGDLLAVVLLGLTSTVCFYFPVATTILTALAIAMMPYCFRMASAHRPTFVVLKTGWPPILANFVLSLIAGIFLEGDVDELMGGLATLVPVINGTGGNIAGIYASRFATSLHKGKRGGHETTGSTLALTTVPAHLAFLLILRVSPVDTTSVSLPIALAYLLAGTIQVLVLLRLGKYLVKRAWARDLDPDNHVVPYLTALSDLIGTTSIVLLSKL